jgi:endonuclease YncB( thermonuclease family)
MYEPALGTGLVVSLPGETVRATVARVVNRHTVLVELTPPLLNPAKLHHYRIGDIVCCHREQGELGETWQAIDERRLAPGPKLPKKKLVRRPAKKKARKHAARSRK